MGYEYPWISGYGYPYLLFGWMDRTSHFFYLVGWISIEWDGMRQDEPFFFV